MADVLERREGLTPVEATASIRRLDYEPALDGLRGLAVLAVLCFHHGFDWATGGFLGVSAFFTLSGFLITWVFAASAGLSTGARLRRFWSRRAKRLLPASWFVVGGVVIADRLGVDLGRLEPADPLSALAQVANWHAIIGDRSYADLFSAPSPLLHYWSLAIEEQFYLLLPLVLLVGLGGITALGDNRRRTATLALVIGLTAASTLWMAALGAGDRSYYGTDTRAAEMLVGVVAALVVMDRRFTPSPQLTSSVRWAAVPAAVGLLALWSFSTITSENLTRGGFLLHALLTSVVMGASMIPGPMRTGLSWQPLVGLGRISYGVYLFHWPIFLVLTQDRVGVEGIALFALRVAVTLALSVGSFVWLEQPIRRGRPTPLRPLVRPAGIAAVAAVLVALAVTVQPERDGLSAAQNLLSTDQSAAAEEADEDMADFADALPELEEGDAAATPVTPTEERLFATVIGDSTALFVGGGLNHWAYMHPESGLTPSTEAWFACTVVRGTEIHYRVGAPTDGAPECQNRETEWPAVVARTDPDVVVLMLGPHDIGNHLLVGEKGGLVHVGQTAFDQRLSDELTSATRLLLDEGVAVIWLTAPQIEVGRDELGNVTEPASADARMDRFNEILGGVVDELAGAGDPVELVDLAGYLSRATGTPENYKLRPDGVHFTFGSAAAVAEAWLAPEVVAAGRRLTGRS